MRDYKSIELLKVGARPVFEEGEYTHEHVAVAELLIWRRVPVRAIPAMSDETPQETEQRKRKESEMRDEGLTLYLTMPIPDNIIEDAATNYRHPDEAWEQQERMGAFADRVIAQWEKRIEEWKFEMQHPMKGARKVAEKMRTFLPSCILSTAKDIWSDIYDFSRGVHEQGMKTFDLKSGKALREKRRWMHAPAQRGAPSNSPKGEGKTIEH